MKKTLAINFLIFFTLILFIECIFGYWFKAENFGIYIRDQRNVERKFDINHYGQNYKYTFKHNQKPNVFVPKNSLIKFSGISLKSINFLFNSYLSLTDSFSILSLREV